MNIVVRERQERERSLYITCKFSGCAELSRLAVAAASALAASNKLLESVSD